MKKLIILIVPVFFGVNIANATYIDFASCDFSGAHEQTEFSTKYSGIDVTIKAHDSANWPLWGDPEDTISWNPGSSGGGVDGLGVNDDEISNDGDELNSEFLYISFNSEIYVDSVDITDLFYENEHFERGAYWVETLSDGWGAREFFAQDDITETPYPGSNGEYELSINSDVIGLWFAGIDYSPEDDYSIRGIEVNAPVPEPATMLLFGTGLAGLAGYRRRQQAKKK